MALVRAESALKELNGIFKKGRLDLESLATAVTAANVLFSAVGLMYDTCYEACHDSGIINRDPKHFINEKDEKLAGKSNGTV